MGKVVMAGRLPGRLREILNGHTLVDPGVADPLAPLRLRGELADADAFLSLLSVRVDDALLSEAPRLSIVANCAVGYDNIDLDACTRRRIAVTNTPGVLTAATADLAMTLILGAARRVVEGDKLARSGRWRGWTADQALGLDLDGATLGIIGMGRIGRAVAARARGFGMRIVYTGPRAVEGEAGFVPLGELLAQADVVSIHCPLSEATHHLLGARELARMKPNSVLVNTARGPIVDEKALVAALHQGRPGFAGLDVFEDEPRIQPGLVANERVMLLPHVGSATRGTRTRMAEMAAESIRERLAGRRPPNLLNPEVIDT
jgi:lactate dehydrogenase-like 2-hydroxyacid dehydrogenase